MQCGYAGHALRSSPACAPRPEPGPSSSHSCPGAAPRLGTPSLRPRHTPPLLRKPAPGPGTQVPPTPHPLARIKDHLLRRLPATPGPGPAASFRPPPAPSRRPSGTRRARAVRAAGRGEPAGGLLPPRRFRFQSKWDEPKSAPRSPHSSPTAWGSIPAAQPPRAATGRDSRVGRRAGVRPAPGCRRARTPGLRRRGGGSALSPGARRAEPHPRGRRAGLGRCRGGATGAWAVRGAGPRVGRTRRKVLGRTVRGSYPAR